MIAVEGASRAAADSHRQIDDGFVDDVIALLGTFGLEEWARVASTVTESVTVPICRVTSTRVTCATLTSVPVPTYLLKPGASTVIS